MKNFPIELRFHEGGNLLFHNIQDIVKYFFDQSITNRSKRMFPSDFHLFINNRRYDWSPDCSPRSWTANEHALKPYSIELDNVEKATRAHLEYVVDIERAFYDAVNIPHEDTILKNS